jgi:hypothetical protein
MRNEKRKADKRKTDRQKVKRKINQPRHQGKSKPKRNEVISLTE